MKSDPEGLCKQPIDEMNHKPQINAKTFTNCTNLSFFSPRHGSRGGASSCGENLERNLCVTVLPAASMHAARLPPGIKSAVCYLVLRQLLKRELV